MIRKRGIILVAMVVLAVVLAFGLGYGLTRLIGGTGNGGTTAAGADPAPQPPAPDLAFVRDGDIWTMNADGSAQTRLTATKEAEAQPFWSAAGDQIYFSRMTRLTARTEYGDEGEWQLFRRDLATGATERVMPADLPTQTEPIRARVSPDGARLALVSNSGADDNELTVRALETGAELLRLPSDSREWVYDVCWSPDGRQIAFPVSTPLQRQGTGCIRIVAADSGALVRTVEHGSDRLDWSRRNKFVIEYGGDPDVGIAVVDIATGRQGWTRLGVGKQPSDARWSPDGTVLAFTMNDFMDGGHATSIMGVRPVKAGSELWLIAKNGESPAWRPTSAVTN